MTETMHLHQYNSNYEINDPNNCNQFVTLSYRISKGNTLLYSFRLSIYME